MKVAADLFVYLLAWVVGDLLGVRRRHVESAISRAGIRDASLCARAMYRSLARGLLELLVMTVRPAKMLARVQVPEAVISEIRANGRGAVIATAHTANWDLAACATARVAPLSIVTKQLSIRLLNAAWQGVRRRRGVKLMSVGEAGRQAVRALRSGELVAMLMDQAPERSRAVARTTFLGAPVWIDLAPALVAMRARVPLIVAFPRRLTDGSYSIEVANVVQSPAVPSRTWAASVMVDATRLLEGFVMEHPDQWLWMHRRWKPLPRDPKAASSTNLAGESA